MNWLTNILEAIKDQEPPARFWRNLVTFRLRSVLHPNSHYRQDTKNTKIGYSSKTSATKAAEKMAIKVGKVFGTYKCFYCDKYHIGKSTKDTSN